MAAYRIVAAPQTVMPANTFVSRRYGGPGEHTFSVGTSAADSLVVDQSAFLVATGSNGYGAVLGGLGAWTVTVNGSILSYQALGISLAPGITAPSTITVGVEGEVGGATAIQASSAVTIRNSGMILGGVDAILLYGAGPHTIVNAATGTIHGSGFAAYAIRDMNGLSNDTVTNHGHMIGQVDLGGGNNTVTNHGTISNMYFGGGIDVVTNHGTIEGSFDSVAGADRVYNYGYMGLYVRLDEGDDLFVNTGTVAQNVELGSGADRVNNAGTIGGSIDSNLGGAKTIVNSGIVGSIALGDSVNSFTNSGRVTSGYAYDGGNDRDVVVNTGTINGTVFLYEGNNAVTNFGTVGAIVAGAGSDVVTNGGRTLDSVDLGNGNDVFTNYAVVGGVTRSGFVDGVVALRGGNDSYFGGGNAETVWDGDGADLYALGGGNDTYRATGHGGSDGADTVSGGLGIDTYDASGAGSSVYINLDTVAHSYELYGSSQLLAQRAVGSSVSGTSHDQVIAFENAKGGTQIDVLIGSAAANRLEGNGSTDYLHGYGGADTLEGGSDMDVLIGGAGKDVLSGGDSADTFIFELASDSTVAVAGRDLITDFEDGMDRIDLSAIDANRLTPATSNEAFSFIGEAAMFFGNSAGQLRAYETATGWVIEGETNGDRVADFAIAVADTNHVISWSSADFFL